MAKLTAKQAKFINYIKQNPEATYREAYLMSYDVKTDNIKTIDNSIQKLINTPSIAGVLKDIEQTVQDELKYSAIDSFNELEEMRQMVLNSPKKDGIIHNAIKCTELKGKIAGLYVDKKELTGSDGGAITIVVNSNIKEEDE